jgi:hypothetical protein
MNQINISVFCKPMTTNTTIYYVSNHPIEHKLCSVQILSMTITYIAINPRRKGQKHCKTNRQE